MLTITVAGPCVHPKPIPGIKITKYFNLNRKKVRLNTVFSNCSAILDDEGNQNRQRKQPTYSKQRKQPTYSKQTDELTRSRIYARIVFEPRCTVYRTFRSLKTQISLGDFIE